MVGKSRPLSTRDGSVVYSRWLQTPQNPARLRQQSTVPPRKPHDKSGDIYSPGPAPLPGQASWSTHPEHHCSLAHLPAQKVGVGLDKSELNSCHRYLTPTFQGSTSPHTAPAACLLGVTANHHTSFFTRAVPHTPLVRPRLRACRRVSSYSLLPLFSLVQ
ncbi:hypothetical protein VTK26DRAFT_7857 [Humicola hyalothermophila]